MTNRVRLCIICGLAFAVLAYYVLVVNPIPVLLLQVNESELSKEQQAFVWMWRQQYEGDGYVDHIIVKVNSQAVLERSFWVACPGRRFLLEETKFKRTEQKYIFSRCFSVAWHPQPDINAILNVDISNNYTTGHIQYGDYIYAIQAIRPGEKDYSVVWKLNLKSN